MLYVDAIYSTICRVEMIYNKRAVQACPSMSRKCTDIDKWVRFSHKWKSL